MLFSREVQCTQFHTQHRRHFSAFIYMNIYLCIQQHAHRAFASFSQHPAMAGTTPTARRLSIRCSTTMPIVRCRRILWAMVKKRGTSALCFAGKRVWVVRSVTPLKGVITRDGKMVGPKPEKARTFPKTQPEDRTPETYKGGSYIFALCL